MLKTFKPIGVFNEPLMDVLVYSCQYELTYSLGRFQEYYENPTLRGTVFSRIDLQDLMPDYYSYWNGFNFPKEVVEEFSNNLNWMLDRHECEALSHMRPGRYIVGVHNESKMKDYLKHERCHALYTSSSKYRIMINSFYKILEKDLTFDIPKQLLDLGYGENVLVDEFQAYLIDGSDTITINREDIIIKELLCKIKEKWSKILKLED